MMKTVILKLWYRTAGVTGWFQSSYVCLFVGLVGVNLHDL